MRRDDLLFYQYDWHAVTEGQKAALQKRVQSLTKKDFDEKSVQELRDELCVRYSLQPPRLDRDNITVSQREIDIDVSGSDRYFSSRCGPHYVKGTEVSVSIPFEGDGEMFKVKPTTWTTVIPRGRVQGKEVMLTISGTQLTAEKVRAEIERQVAEIQQWLGFQEQSVGSFPAELARIAQQALEARRAKLAADDNLIAGLGYKTR